MTRLPEIGVSFELSIDFSIDFIVDTVKYVWIPNIMDNNKVVVDLFGTINDFASVFCKERENDDKDKRKELILLLYILYTVSTDIGKQKQEFNTVSDYENYDMKIEFCQATGFNQFLTNKGFNNLLELTRQFQIKVKEEEGQKQKDIEIQSELKKL